MRPAAIPANPPALAPSIAFVALVAGAIAMGVSPIFVRLAEIGPFASAFWRASLALPVLWFWLAWEKPADGAFAFNRATLLAGLFFAGDLTFWHLAIMNTTIANATLMSCLAPVWVALLSGAFIGEKVGKTVFIGLGLCLLGAACLIGESMSVAPARLWGDIYGVVTSLFFGLYFLAIRVARRSARAGTVTFRSTFITASVLLVIALVSGNAFVPQTATGVAALLALGFISHAGGQGLLAIALGVLSAAFSSLVIFIEALAAAIFAWLVFAEILTLVQAGGGLLILAGIWIARPRPAATQG